MTSCELPTSLGGWIDLLWKALVFFGVVHNTVLLRRNSSNSSDANRR